MAIQESNDPMVQRFFRNHCVAEVIDFETLVNSLFPLCLKLRPAVWSQYKHALVKHLQILKLDDEAKELKSSKNPVTSADSTENMRNAKPKAKPRCRKVKEADHRKLMSYLTDQEERSLCAALTIAYLTGMRPAEMFNMQLKEEDHSVHITTAKKTDNGKRGIDRTLILNQDDFKLLQNAYHDLLEEKTRVGFDPERAMKRIQNRLYYNVRKVWPRRKIHITLYSYRHQFGSNLKASDMDPITVSAIMGHQSVNSIEVYGNARSSTRTPQVQVNHEARLGVRNTLLRQPDFNYISNKESTRTTSKAHTLRDVSMGSQRAGIRIAIL